MFSSLQLETAMRISLYDMAFPSKRLYTFCILCFPHADLNGNEFIADHNLLLFRRVVKTSYFRHRNRMPGIMHFLLVVFCLLPPGKHGEDVFAKFRTHLNLKG